MRASTLLTAAFAAMTVAKPVALKRDFVTEIAYVTVVHYVTADGPAPTPAPEAPVEEPEDQVEYTPPFPEVEPIHDAPVEAEKPVEEVPEKPVEEVPAPIEYDEPPAPSPKEQPAPVQPTGPPGPDAPMVEVVLYNHNIHRSNHSAESLTYDNNLAASAQALADTCVFSHDTSLGPARNYGQNLAASGPTMDLGQQISGGWYASEEPLFRNFYGLPNPTANFHQWGHMTQLTWKGTKQVGCAIKDCRGSALGMWYTVCNYAPAGNVAGAYAENVGRPEGGLAPYAG